MASLFDHAIRLGDDALILGQRLSEWAGHAPMLEVDLALSNIALDLIGQATLFLKLAGEVHRPRLHERKSTKLSSIVFEKPLPSLRRKTATNASSSSIHERLLHPKAGERRVQ